MKPPDEDIEIESIERAIYKMVNMNGTHAIQSADNCRSVRNTIDLFNSNDPPLHTVSTPLSQHIIPPEGALSMPNGYSTFCANTQHWTNQNASTNNSQSCSLSTMSNNIQTNTQQNNSSNTVNNAYNGQTSLQLIGSYPLTSTSRLVQTLTVALVYYREVTIGGIAKSRQEQELPVGTLIIDKATCQRMTARQLREKIQKDIPHDHFNDFNANYVFLTRQGSPLEHKYEESVSAWSVVNSKRQQIRFRLESNIFHVMMSNDLEKSRFMLLFTIRSPFDNSLKDVREVIRNRMLQVIPEKPFCSTSEFVFLCDRRITVSRSNEANVKLVDILCGSSTIKLLSESDNSSKMNKVVSANNLHAALSTSATQIHQMEKYSEASRKPSSRKPNRKPSFLRNFTRTKTKSVQIMLSYARSDMVAYVKQLKEELTKLGLSVYLDVDEIKSGQDWQDSLNEAVQNVDYFVPLISQNYGKTKWTNKEVKLADICQKVIIPINFLESFPPECLAIQFCTTQYISWHGLEAHDSKSNQKFDTWSNESIRLVAKRVHERIQELKTTPSNSSFSNTHDSNKPQIDMMKDTDRDASILKHISFSNDKRKSFEPKIIPRSYGEILNQNTALCPRKKIMISAHPEQAEETQKIKAILRDVYDVWVTSEDIIKDNQHYSSNKSLDRIPEEEIITTNGMRDYGRKLGEINKIRANTKVKIDPENRTNISAKQLITQSGKFMSSLSPHKQKELVEFQTMASECDIVLIVESQRYYNSRTSERHVYYVGNRKKIIRITTDQSTPPVWYSNINSQITTTLDYDSATFEADLKSNIKNVIENKVQIIEVQENTLRKAMEGVVPELEKLVYICGSTDDKLDQRSVALCREISAALFESNKLIPVTNGFHGISQTLAKMYEEQRMARTGQIGNGSNENNDNIDSQIINLVPVRDNKDCSSKAAQKKDSTFEALPYGKTFFYGNSMEERDSNVAKIIDVCILLGGNKGQTEYVREFEEFRWNDHYVIPIPFTDNDSDNPVDILESKIYECPKGVTPEYWNKLIDVKTPPAEVAKTLIIVICEIKRIICEHLNGNVGQASTLSNRKKRMAKRQSKLTSANNPNLSQYWESDEISSFGNPNLSLNDVTDGHESDASKTKFKINFKIPLFNKNKS